MRLDPQTVDLSFRSNPTGLQLTVGSSPATTPVTRTVIVGSRNTIAAPLIQEAAPVTAEPDSMVATR